MGLKSVSFGNRMFYSELKSPFQKVLRLVLSKETPKESRECFEFYRQISEWIIGLGDWTAIGWVHCTVFSADFCHVILLIWRLNENHWSAIDSLQRVNPVATTERPATAERDSRERRCAEPEYFHILLKLKVYFDSTRGGWGKNNHDGFGEERKIVIRMFLCP